jgi:signal transduction histidine kinase
MVGSAEHLTGGSLTPAVIFESWYTYPMAAVHEIHAASNEPQSDSAMPSEIVASWERAREAGVDPERPVHRRVSADELRARLQASEDLVETARPHLPWVSAFLGDIPHAVYVVDTSGIVLHSIGSRGMRQPWFMRPGWDWSEARMGTNGAGTALASGVPIAVVGAQHYCKELATAACLGAPIVVESKIMGAIDLSVPVQHRNPRFMVLVTHTAQVIAEQILARVAQRRVDVFSDRLGRLQGLARTLARTLSRSELADAMLVHAFHALGADAAVGYELDESGDRLRWLGGRALPDLVHERLGTLSLQSPLPLAVAVATGKPVLMPTRAAIAATFPMVLHLMPPERFQAFVALPLLIDGRSIGGIAFSFDEPRVFDDGEREYLLTIADHFAVALDRVSKFERERVAREAAEQARQELEHTEQVRERILGMIGHDLRSPLSAVIVAADLLRVEPCPHRHERLGERIAASGARMERMITQLMDFTRARLGGGIPIQPVPADLAALCRRAVDEIQMAHPGVRVQASIGTPVWGRWDPDRLAEVIANLLGNAIDHGAPGTPVEVTLYELGADAVLRVRNQGTTIPAEDRSLIFDPFHRGRVLGRRQGKRAGLGLGLYIVRQIVMAHGGTVDVESADGMTTFSVILPRSESPVSPVE